MIRTACLTFFILTALLGLGRLSALSPPLTAPPEATPVMMVTSDRMAPPPTVFPPTQADQGAQVYYQVCSTCHGDRGQGLTEEWRNQIGPPDSNCWLPTCHGPRHPIEGFIFPKQVPAVVGPQVLPGYQNAKNLHDFLRKKMPWQAPGRLSDAEYWQLTAYLVRANGYNPGSQPLDDSRAAAITFGIPPAHPPAPGPSPTYYLLAGGAVAVFLLALLFARNKLKH
jgi:mono/diheme cytochrome c family protein